MEKKNKHLSYDDRLEIERGLKQNLSFKAIGKVIGKDCTTISKEIKNHMTIVNSGCYGRAFNNCKNRTKCEFRNKQKECDSKNCTNYEKEDCNLLLKPPYVCNACKRRNKCTLSKHLYDAKYAFEEYEEVLKESRQGITYTEQELDYLNDILKPLIVDQKQSVHHAFINNKNKIMCSEKQIYRLIDNESLSIKSIDLSRKVRRRLSRKPRTTYKIDRNCLQGRKYEDFLKYKEDNPDIAVVQMDSVEGNKGGKVLLTLYFTSCNFMLAFIRDHNDAQSVIDAFNKIEELLGIDTFKLLFPVILADNGSEFSNPKEIEFSPFTGEQRTKMFYCEPGRPDQKGACEVNHEFIRYYFKKGDSFDDFSQNDISLMMSHINSYKRKKLNDRSPYELFSFFFSENIANKLGINFVEANKIILSKNIFNN